eukprot:g2684.t1
MDKAEEGIFLVGEPIKETETKKWYREVELEPLEETGSTENFRVKIGDDVIVDSDEDEHSYVIRVTEFFKDESRLHSPCRFKGQWFYRIEDTLLMITSKDGTCELPLDREIGRRDGLEGRRIWLSEKSDSDEIAKVKHVDPNDPVPNEQECDFWYNQTHSRQFYTFRDLYKKESTQPRHPLRRLHVLDLFCGCGGLSFLEQKDFGTEIKCTHAVDMDADAIRTYQVNHPATKTHLMCVEEFLYLCKHYHELCTKLEVREDEEVLGSKRRKFNIENENGGFKILSMHLQHSVKRMKDGQGENQLRDDLKMSNTWLVFTCRLEDGKQRQLKADEVMKHFPILSRFLSDYNLPRPGDIQVIVGGPPCQGVSGLNRHAHKTDVLSCYRNRLVKSFFRTIEFFKPDFTLMENVQDIMKKEDGAYAKYATAQLLALGYQSRLGLIAAGDHGAAQGRWRCFLWGALSGKVLLPPFPQPAFRVSNFKTPIHNSAKCCQVSFLSEKDKTDAFPVVLNEEVISDLPKITNWTVSENSIYKSKPLRPIQKWLRRNPREDELPLSARAKRADEQMKTTVEVIKKMVEERKKAAKKENKPIEVKVGELLLCQKLEGRKNDFAGEIRQEYLRQICEGPDADQKLEELQNRKTEMMKEHGGALLEELNKINEITIDDNDDLLRDHRSRMCNSDDYFRISSVPAEPGKNFRDMPGVVTNIGGTCCAGHTHAFIGQGCEGGGTTHQPKQSTHKESRIDHADKDGWRGLSLEGCLSRTVFTPTMDLVCPRWCITYKRGLSGGRHGCFGRIQLDQVQPTVVTRAEPHNLQICHPYQHRVLSVREMARCQGFPDYYVFVGTERDDAKKRTLSRLNCIDNRYKQIGNAVAPPVAAALGRCLLLAASAKLEQENDVIRTLDQEMVKVLKEAKDEGLKFYAEEIPLKAKSETTEVEGDDLTDYDDEFFTSYLFEQE